MQKRAAAEHIAEDDVDDALEAEQPKAALITLILDRAASRGPSERIRETMETGGEAAAEMLGGVLEHASEVLEQQAVSSPRKARRGMLALADRVEGYAESLDAEWCDRVRHAGRDDLDEVCGMLASVDAVTAATSDVTKMVSG